MKHFADQHRSEREFMVGEMVYLKLQPYIQSSVAPRANQKLSFKFYGPFKVLERTGVVAIVYSCLILAGFIQWCIPRS